MTGSGAHGTVAARHWPGSDDGVPVVLLHGVDGSSAGWLPVVDRLLAANTEGRASITAVDLRGRGDSSTDGPWGVTAHAEDIVTWLTAELGRRPVVLVGHSFGGHVAARVAADRPDLVDRLVLVDGGLPRVVPEGLTPEGLCDGALANILPGAADKGCSPEAVEADFRSMVTDPAGSDPIFAVTGSVFLVRAELGVAPGLPPVVPDSVVQRAKAAGVDIDDVVIEGATHFTIVSDPSPQLISAIG